MSISKPASPWAPQAPPPVNGAEITAERLRASAVDNLSLAVATTQDVLGHIARGGAFDEGQKEIWMLGLLALVDAARGMA